MNESETDIYGPDTLISSYTNRAIPTVENVVKKLPVFWCDPCSLKLASPTQAIQHLTGRLHKIKVTPKEDGALRKRVLDSDGNPVEEPTTKRCKLEEVDQSIPCKECNIVLNSAIMAEQHFKGKKHASTLVKLANAAKPIAPPVMPVDKTRFCKYCNITLNSDGQEKQHCDGKSHKLNAGIIPPITPNQRGGVRGRGQVHNGKENGRIDLDYDRGRGGGGIYGGRGRGDSRGRGRGDSRGRGRGDSRGRGFGRGNSEVRGRGLQRLDWGRGKQHFSRGGGVPVGGQYGNGPPPFDDSSPNFQEIGSECYVPGSSRNDYFASESSTKENFKPPTNFYSKPPLPNGPSSYIPPRNMQHNDQRNNLCDNSSTSKDYFGGSSSNAPPYNSSLPPKNYRYIPPPALKDTFNGNYYSKGYRSNNYSNSHDTYGNRNRNEFQMNNDVMYDSYYG